MPESMMTLFPNMLNWCEAMKVPLRASLALSKRQMQAAGACVDVYKDLQDLSLKMVQQYWQAFPGGNNHNGENVMKLYRESAASLLDLAKDHVLNHLNRFHRKRAGELEFLEFFTDRNGRQDWSVEYDRTNIMLDLAGMRVIDISADVRHRIHNYGVVFAPRAGHHSNIAERVALFLRDQGLTRMAVVEQKCAEEIPLNVNGHRHREDFEGQVEQYRQVLELLKLRTGYPPHLIAICQPGPLLLSTLILYPGLGKTFGSAGSPMDTEAEKGFLTEFARKAGEGYIDQMLSVFGHVIGREYPGAGRLTFDGRLQVLGFYLMAWDQHFKNFTNLLTDMQKGDTEAVRRQKAFYQWYNTVHHFPAGFIRDTYKKIFVQNALIRGHLKIGGRTVDIANYPTQTPIWALGGKSDHIAPPGQAVGHLDSIPAMSNQIQMRLLCDAGHMGLFRSRRILKEYYHRIARFLLAHSDCVNHTFCY